MFDVVFCAELVDVAVEMLGRRKNWEEEGLSTSFLHVNATDSETAGEMQMWRGL